MTRFIFWMMGVKTLPSPRVLWWRNIIIGAFTLVFAVNVAYALIADGATMATKEALILAGMPFAAGALLLLGATFFLGIYYGPVQELSDGLKEISDGLSNAGPEMKAAGKAVWQGLRKLPAALVALLASLKRLPSWLAQAAKAIGSMRAEHCIAAVFVIVTLVSMPLSFIWLWPVSQSLVAHLPTWLVKDAGDAWFFSLITDVTIASISWSVFTHVLALGTGKVIKSLVARTKP